MLNEELMIPDEVISDHIYLIRDQKVMIDRDLAKLYHVETKALKQAVKRNPERFPEDFMFELTGEEAERLRSHFVTLNEPLKRGQHSKYLPTAFTEQGVAMLSSVLKSKRAISVNIQIVRLFTRLRKTLACQAELKQEIEQFKQKLDMHDHQFEVVFHFLDNLVDKKEQAKTRTIGFAQNTGNNIGDKD